MADIVYKDLGMTAEELESSIASAKEHNADAAAHVSATDRPTWNAKANKTELSAHTANANIHVTAAEKEKLAGLSNYDDSEIKADISEMFSEITVYLSPTGSDDNDGLTTSSRMQTLSAALEKHKNRYSLRLSLEAGEYTAGTITVENKRVAFSGANRDTTVINGTLTFNNCTVTASNVTFKGSTSDRSLTLQYSFLSCYRANFINEGSGEALLCVYSTNAYLDGSIISTAGTNAIRSSGAATLGLGYCIITGNIIASTGGEIRVVGGSRTGITKESGGIIFIDGALYNATAAAAE